MFALHERLAADTFLVTQSTLSSVLLMNNQAFPWLILVPRIAGAREIIDLAPQERHQLMDEIAFASQALQQLFTPDKLNVAALGNQVPALHVHVIARFTQDRMAQPCLWARRHRLYRPCAHTFTAAQLLYAVA